MAGRMKFNLKDFRDKLNVEPQAKTTPGISDVAIVKIGVKKMAFRGRHCISAIKTYPCSLTDLEKSVISDFQKAIFIYFITTFKPVSSPKTSLQ